MYCSQPEAPRADFRYTSTVKITGGAAVSGTGSGGPPSTYLYKGQKARIDTGDIAVILDFDAHTVTTLHAGQRTYSVKSFSESAPATNTTGAIKSAARATGQTRTINGFNSHETVMTVDMEDAKSRQLGTGMEMEADVWASPDVPGARELHAFFTRNKADFPWAALTGGNNPATQLGMAAFQRGIADMDGVQMLQLIRMKAGGASLLEITVESSGFSTAAIPDSMFAIPADYRKQ